MRRIKKQDILQQHRIFFRRFSALFRDLFLARSRVKLEARVWRPASSMPGSAAL